MLKFLTSPLPAIIGTVVTIIYVSMYLMPTTAVSAQLISGQQCAQQQVSWMRTFQNQRNQTPEAVAFAYGTWQRVCGMSDSDRPLLTGPVPKAIIDLSKRADIRLQIDAAPQ